MITLTVVTKVISRKQEEFLQTMRSLASALDRKGSGNPTLYQEVNDQTIFNLVYELGTREELKKLLSAEEFKVLLGAFRVLCEKSKVRYKYNCRNWPRHACATYEACRRPLGTKIRKGGKKWAKPLLSGSQKESADHGKKKQLLKENGIK